jgi:hypothetical protein
MMNSTHISQASAPRDVDLERTRRTFLFAREQVAAHTRANSYSAVRETRRRVIHGPDSNAR